MAETSPDKTKDVPGDPESGPDKAGNIDEANLHYEGNLCIYTDPETKYQHSWDETSQSWVPYEKAKTDNDSAEVAPDAKDGAPPGDYDFDGESYVYKDSSGVTYKWDSASNEWKVKDTSANGSDTDKGQVSQSSDGIVGKPTPGAPQDMASGVYGYEGDTHTYTDPSDGTVYFWDHDKNAWFPKVSPHCIISLVIFLSFPTESVNKRA